MTAVGDQHQQCEEEKDCQKHGPAVVAGAGFRGYVSARERIAAEEDAIGVGGSRSRKVAAASAAASTAASIGASKGRARWWGMAERCSMPEWKRCESMNQDRNPPLVSLLPSLSPLLLW